MALPSVVGTPQCEEFAGVTEFSLTVSPTAGNALVAAYEAFTANRPMHIEYSATERDSANNVWSTPYENGNPGNNYLNGAAYAVNVASGSTTVKWKQNGGFPTQGQMSLIEVSNLPTSSLAAAFDTWDNNDNGSGTTTHLASAAGINTAANVFVIVTGVVDVDRGALTPKASPWVRLTDTTGTPSLNNYLMCQYRTSASALSGEQGEWTQGTGSPSAGVILSLKGASGGGTTDAVGTAAATSAASGIGAATAAAGGAASAIAVATAVARAIVAATATVAAVASAAAVGVTIAAAIGTGTATSSAVGTARSTAASVGTSAATAAASAVGDSLTGASSSGTITATSAASGVGASTAAAVGTAAATGAASGVTEVLGTSSSVGTAAATTAATGVGACTAASVGTAAAIATASASGADAASDIVADDSHTWAAGQRDTTWATGGRDTTWRM